MAPRFPLSEVPDPSALKVMEDTVKAMHSSDHEWKDSKGDMLGPYGPLSYSPIVLSAWWALAKATYDPNSIKPRNRELVILGVCSLKCASYVIKSHREMFIALGFSSQQYDEGLRGSVPMDLSEEEAMAYQLGRTLTELKGPMSNTVWQEACDKMGRQEVLGAVHIAAAYDYVSMLSNINVDED